MINLIFCRTKTTQNAMFCRKLCMFIYEIAWKHLKLLHVKEHITVILITVPVFLSWQTFFHNQMMFQAFITCKVNNNTFSFCLAFLCFVFKEMNLTFFFIIIETRGGQLYWDFKLRQNCFSDYSNPGLFSILVCYHYVVVCSF